MSQSSQPAYLAFDVETVPDGELLARVRYPNDQLTPAEAVERMREEMLAKSGGKSDFIPYSYCLPIAVCVARVCADYSLEAITCLDAPKFRPQEIVADFWRGLARYQSSLVSFNGRAFDMPVLELAAFRWGISAPNHFSERFGRRYRYGTQHLDMADWLSNHGAAPVAGGLNLLSKLLGKPGKFHIDGSDVYELHLQGKTHEINDYCMFDVLDTYFVFLRTRVMTADIDLKQEQNLVERAREWISKQSSKRPALKLYLENWGRWKPWIA